jgi:hypothetical protein
VPLPLSFALSNHTKSFLSLSVVNTTRAPLIGTNHVAGFFYNFSPSLSFKMSSFSVPTLASQYKMASDHTSPYDTFRHPLELRYASAYKKLSVMGI